MPKNKRNKTSCFDRNQYPEELLRKIHYWIPPVPEFKPLKKQLNSSLRIGAIVDTRLYQGLRFEGELFVLTPDNWQQVLNYGEIDFLIVESCWQSVYCHWRFGQFNHSENNKALIDIIHTATERDIPTIYWNTQDFLHHDRYKEFASHFDYVFCADPRESQLLEHEGIKSDMLLPAIQPIIHNGFKPYEPSYPDFSINVLYDGFTDIYRLKDKLNFLADILPYGLKIIESQGEIFCNKVKGLSNFSDSFLGTVTSGLRLSTLKYTKTEITTDQTLRSKTLQQWLALETMACRVPILHKGNIPTDDVRHGLVSCYTVDDLFVMLECFEQDDLYRQRISHLAWREIMRKHTFSHRIRTICQKINIKHNWQKHPSISVITPTFRPELIDRVIDSFNEQSYPNKELIIVVNRNISNAEKHINRNIDNENIKITTVPSEQFVGACLNIGATMASGDYCIRMDDDDYYGKECIADIMLHNRAIKFDIFGKPTNFFTFEDEDSVYQRFFRVPEMTTITPNKLQYPNFHVAGNLLGGKTRIFQDTGYLEGSFGAADTSFLISQHNKKVNYCCLDCFNLLISRSSDETSHTWRIKEEELKKTATVSAELTDDDVNC
ncbi:MAG: glycosyltransferase [Desulfocapsa sp.]|nr:glycosyltransferase [Desulfocapsa sp.]